MANKIKNLLFDLGGVLLSLDRNKCVARLKELGMTDAEDVIGLYTQSSEFGDFESGKIGKAEFYAAMRQHFTHEVSNEQIDEALERFITELPVARLQALRKLHERYSLYVLSNTNSILFPGIIKRLFQQEGFTINEYFDGITTSYEAHSCKPNREIFDYAVRTMGIRPEETLFFDDGQANVDAARALGFQAELVPEGGEFMDVVNRLKL